MEAQLHRASHGHEDGGAHSGEQQHHEKKSALKKVKDKAKKMKNTLIKKHAHAQQHHDNDNDKDEEAHQVHGAPVHESTVVRSTNLPKDSPANLPHSPSTEKRSDDGLNSATSGVADKAISIKNMVASKLGYSGGEDGQSMKEYLCEKLKPGDEEDKAVSQPKRGKVTVSKEVAERLGTAQENKREGEDALAAGEDSTGQGVAERLQNAVSSWLGKSNGIESAQDSMANAFVSGGGGPMSKEPHHT